MHQTEHQAALKTLHTLVLSVETERSLVREDLAHMLPSHMLPSHMQGMLTA